MTIDKEKTICVYGASSAQLPEEYYEAAKMLGNEIARRGLTLVSGAGRAGLMAAVNDGAIASGGTTVGVIPRFMHERGWTHQGLSKVIVTEDMHERKREMARISRSVIALPGGSGTLEELLEIITWRQLGLFRGQIVLLDTAGYYQSLLSMFDRAIADGFMTEQHRTIWKVATTPRQAVDYALQEPEISEFQPKIN